MRSRGLVVAIAVVLAILAAVGVIVYTNQVEKTVTQENTVEVMVSTQDIPPNTALNPLIDEGQFEQIRVPDDALVAGAVTTLDDLRDRVSSAPILANEQIPLSRLGEGTQNNVGVSKDHVGLGIEVGGPESVNGLVQRGDNIAVYATFAKGTPVVVSTLAGMLDPAQIQDFLDAVRSGGSPTAADIDVFVMPFDYTVTLVPSVKVLSVQNPQVDEASGRQESGSATFVLDLLPEDAEEIVFAHTTGSLWLGLLPPENEDGYAIEGRIGAPLGKVVGVGPK